METKKLYYDDCRLAAFTAAVIDCRQTEQSWLVTLDQTAFYPEGGGQAADIGTLNGVRVRDVQEQDGQIIHCCDAPLPIGGTVEGVVDYARRFDLMQQHTGEHIVSGLIHARYGHHNVGFHMSSDVTTIDFDGPIPAGDLAELERLANEAIYKNIPLHIWTPSPEELPTVFYRTKRALPWPVRIVQVPGYDSCACCGIHVERTGEIGLIKLLSCVKFRSGVRMEMICGRRALDYLTCSHEQNRLVSAAFSAKLFETGEAAVRMNETLDAYKLKISQLEGQVFDAIAHSCRGKGDVLIMHEGLDSVGVRKLADAVAEVCGGTAAVFSGSDGSGYSYCLIRRGGDLRGFNREMIQALNGRGGGRPECQMGSVQAGRESVLKHFVSFYTTE